MLSGSFSNSIVVNAEFRSTSPKGESISGPTPSYKIEWYSGKFDGGIFGVDVQYPVYEDLVFEYPYESIWYNGDFNGGKFADISKWKLGRFNGGEFISYYGYPEVRYPYQYFIGHTQHKIDLLGRMVSLMVGNLVIFQRGQIQLGIQVSLMVESLLEDIGEQVFSTVVSLSDLVVANQH